MNKFADIKRIERNFDKDDWIYVKLQPYRQISISKGKHQKLGPRFYGPFEIEDRVGTVAYHLRLSAGSSIHNVIHVSQLKKHISRGLNVSPTLPITSPEGQLQIYPEYVLAQMTIKRNNEAIPRGCKQIRYGRIMVKIIFIFILIFRIRIRI
jgi:hypothetical protein